MFNNQYSGDESSSFSFSYPGDTGPDGAPAQLDSAELLIASLPPLSGPISGPAYQPQDCINPRLLQGGISHFPPELQTQPCAATSNMSSFTTMAPANNNPPVISIPEATSNNPVPTKKRVSPREALQAKGFEVVDLTDSKIVELSKSLLGPLIEGVLKETGSGKKVSTLNEIKNNNRRSS